MFLVLLQYRFMGLVKVNLYCIVTPKLKPYLKDFNLRATVYILA